MLFRRQNDATTTINTNTAQQRPLTANTSRPTTEPAMTATRTTSTTGMPTTPTPVSASHVTPTAPISHAQQRRVIATPSGSFSMPANTTGSRDTIGREGTRKLQVGRDITLNGEIGACDHLAIEGTVTATIKQLQQFDILDHGQFSGSVTTENADINGQFEGDLTVTGRLWLRANAVVTGTIHYAALQVEKGACLRGTVDMIESQTPVQTGATFTTNDVANDSVQG